MLGIIIGVTFDLNSFRQVVGRLNPLLIAATLGMLVTRVYFGGLRLSHISNRRLSPAAGIRGQLAWDFFSNVTPSAVGGGPFAAVFIARDRNIRVGEATALMLFSMLLDQLWFAFSIPIVVTASFFWEVIPKSFGTIGTSAFIIYYFGLLLWITAFGYATLFRPVHLQKILDRVFRLKWLRRFQKRVDQEMDQLRLRARILRTQSARFYIKGILLTFGTWISRYLFLMFVVWSIYSDVDKFLLLIRTAAMQLGALILPTPGGSGGIEGLYALFIGPLMPAAALAPSLLIWRSLGYYLFIVIGIFLTTHHVQKSIHRRRHLEAFNTDGDAVAGDGCMMGKQPKPEIVDSEQ